MPVLRVLVRGLGGGLLLALVLASPAAAHDPVFVDDATPAAESPVIQDGTISFAVYGTIAEAGGSSHVRLDLADGDTFNLEVLVPDRDPENTLDDFSHLTITTTAPDGSSTELQGDVVIDRFDEPFTNTSYLRLIEFEAPAVAGTYELTVTSSRPTRFTVATGRKEQFGTEVANYQRVSLDAVADWYATPPPDPAPAPTTDPEATTTTLLPSTPESGSVPPSTAPLDRAAEGDAEPTTPASASKDNSIPVLVAGAGLLAAVAAAGWWIVRRRGDAGGS